MYQSARAPTNTNTPALDQNDFSLRSYFRGICSQQSHVGGAAKRGELEPPTEHPRPGRLLQLHITSRSGPSTVAPCEIAWRRWKQPDVAVCGVAPVAARIVPVFPGGTPRYFRGATADCTAKNCSAPAMWEHGLVQPPKTSNYRNHSSTIVRTVIQM